MSTLELFLNTLGDRLRMLRKREGLSQEKLAELTGFHRTYISGLERGRINPTAGNLHRISIALEIPLEELFVKDDLKEDDNV